MPESLAASSLLGRNLAAAFSAFAHRRLPVDLPFPWFQGKLLENQAGLNKIAGVPKVIRP